MAKEKILAEVVEKLDKLGHIPDLFLKGGLAYAGFRATGNIGGAITALVGLRLAEGNNLAGGAAGVTALTLVGIGNAFKDMQATSSSDTGIGANAPVWTFLNDWLFPNTIPLGSVPNPYAWGPGSDR